MARTLTDVEARELARFVLSRQCDARMVRPLIERREEHMARYILARTEPVVGDEWPGRERLPGEGTL